MVWRPRAGRLIAACAVATAFVAPTAGASATQPAAAQWTPVASPPAVRALQAGLASIACRSMTSCIAVGGTNGLTGGPFADAWNGARWTRQPTANLGAGTSAWLGSLACAQANLCFAVGTTTPPGNFYFSPLIERWNGTQWSVESVPVPPDGNYGVSLYSVSCGSPTSCMAVGSYDTGSETGRLIEHWDGTKWSLESSPSPSPVHRSEFRSVSCASPTTCTAVGDSEVAKPSGLATTRGEVIEQWNGSQWSITSANKYPDDSGLYSVSCFDTWHCLTTGPFVALRGEGTVWSDVSPAKGVGPGFGAVACTAPLACTTVDSKAMQWNGSLWQSGKFPSASKYGPSMSGIACVATGSCIAVGSSGGGTQAELLHGTTWSSLAVPDPIGAAAGFVHGVSCDTATHCVAVGMSYGETAVAPYIEDWNGNTWSLDRGPVRFPFDTQLESVSCPNSQTCVAVGEQYSARFGSTGSVALVLRSGHWYVYKFSNIYQLTGVSCTGPSRCIAVGGSFGSGIAVWWNGTRWSSPQIVVAPPPYSQHEGYLASVACTGTSDCTAVGWYTPGTGPEPVVARWRAGVWHTQALTAPTSFPDNRFTGVACSTAARCVAVGVIDPDTTHSSALVAESNGNTWHVAVPPLPQGTTTSQLNGVACIGATSQCWATGWTANGPTQQPALEHWGGAQWSYSPGPAPATGNNSELDGVACGATGQCMAVGQDTRQYGAPLAAVYR